MMNPTRGRSNGRCPAAPNPPHQQGATVVSNHFSAANLQHPGDDARLDLTDLFVFAAPMTPIELC